MFGYITTYEPELKIRESVYYNAMYCGLCRSMGKCTGFCSRCTLNYDMVFLAAIRLVLTNTTTELKVENKKCLVHPFSKKPFVSPNPVFEYCSYASALLVHGKLMDDIEDEKGLKRLKARLSLFFMKQSYKKAAEILPELDQKIREKLSDLSKGEKSDKISIDKLADESGELLKLIFSYGLTDLNAAIAGSIGKNIGKWLYIIDAIDDFSSDIEKNRFNPIEKYYDSKLMNNDILTTLSMCLLNILSDAEPTFDLISYSDTEADNNIKGIVNNIIYLGLPRRIQTISKKYPTLQDAPSNE